MAAGMRAIDAIAPVIDVVVEVRDARIPESTRVAGLHPKLKSKPAVVLLNREDLADPHATVAWLAALRTAGAQAFAGVGTRAATLRDVREALVRRPRRKSGKLRIAVIGAPNTGKSAVINALARRKRAVAENRAGVTRHVRWLKLADDVEMLDTPGVLAPRITSADSAWQLAACGSLPETAYDPQDVVEHLAAWARAHGMKRASDFDLESFARAHGMLRKGGELDRLAAARKMLASFRAGSLARLTFERPVKEHD
jgi:ribosome biogenesis GTPase A